MDEKYLDCPFYGSPRMHDWLTLDMGYAINRKRTRRLYRLMGLQSVLPQPNTSKRAPCAYIYPYLLRWLTIEHVNHVWEVDITYIPMKHGYMYLIAIVDVFSRFVLRWDVSSTMDATWCTSVLRETIQQYGAPEIFNSDQGSQFTSDEWIGELKSHNIQISMDGKGRALDNIFIERLWRTVKYEHVYLVPAADGRALYTGLQQYFHFYNFDRRHKSLAKKTPSMVYTP